MYGSAAFIPLSFLLLSLEFYAQSDAAVYHLMLQVLVTAVTLGLLFCTLFCRRKKSFNLLSNDEKCAFLTLSLP